MPPKTPIQLPQSLEVLRNARTDQVVVTTMGSAREWMKLGSDPLDFIYAPSAMGGASAVGLGIALAQPDRQVIVGNGDGCMLMNLGNLVTITAQAPKNYLLIVFENGVYEVTGMQQTAANAHSRTSGDGIDLCAVARSCGFSSVFEYRDLETWRNEIGDVLAASGPTFVVLHVEPMPGALVPRSPAPAPERAKQFRETLTAKT